MLARVIDSVSYYCSRSVGVLIPRILFFREWGVPTVSENRSFDRYKRASEVCGGGVRCPLSDVRVSLISLRVMINKLRRRTIACRKSLKSKRRRSSSYPRDEYDSGERRKHVVRHVI